MNTLPTQEALIIVDYTGGFANKKLNELYVNGGESLAPAIRGTIAEVKSRGGKIIATRDYHKRGKLMNFARNFIGIQPFSLLKFEDVAHWTDDNNALNERAEFTVAQLQEELKKNGDMFLWPDHSVEETEGAEFYELDEAQFDAKIKKGEGYIESYSGFGGVEQETGETLLEVLQRFEVKIITIVGLATDYCVKETALDAVKAGFTVKLSKKGVAAVTPEGETKAFKELEAAGVTLID